MTARRIEKGTTCTDAIIKGRPLTISQFMDSLLFLETSRFYDAATHAYVHSVVEWLEKQEPTDTFVWATGPHDQLTVFKFQTNTGQVWTHPTLDKIQ